MYQTTVLPISSPEGYKSVQYSKCNEYYTNVRPLGGNLTGIMYLAKKRDGLSNKGWAAYIT
jgi:hypothetical protein